MHNCALLSREASTHAYRDRLRNRPGVFKRRSSNASYSSFLILFIRCIILLHLTATVATTIA